MMKKLLSLLVAGYLLCCSAWAQISGPVTVPAGTSVSFYGPSGQQSYTWNKDNPIEIDAVTTNISAVKMFDLAGQVQEAKVFYDRGKWWAFTYTWNAPLEVKRYDLGADPTVPFTGTPDVVYSYTTTTRARALAIYHDNVTDKWHMFMSTQGSLAQIVRMDFDSLGGTPVTTVLNLNLPAPLDAGGVIHLDMQIVKENGEYFLFLPEYNGKNSQSGWCARVDLGNAITNNPVATGVLPASGAGNSTSLAFYKQDDIWYALQVHIGNTLRRYKFTNGLKQAPTVEQVAGVDLTGVSGSDKYRIRLIAGNCGQQLLAYIHGSRTILRLDFNGDITSVPDVTQSIINTTTYAPVPASNVGLDLYVYNNKLYTYLGSSNPSAMYNVLLSDLPAGTEHIYDNPEYTTTFAVPGTYEVQLTTNIGMSLPPQSYCYTVNVVAPSGPSAPGPFVSPVTVVCADQGDVTYEVGAVSGIDSYEWEYTGTGVMINSSAAFPVSVPANPDGHRVTVRYAANATSGELRVRTKSGSNASVIATTAFVTVNPIPVVGITPGSTVTICAGQSTALTADGAATYSWSPSGGTGATETVSPSTTTTYTVTGTSLGCSATATRQVTVTPLPVVNITPATASVCAGDNIMLTATGAATYSWSHNGGSNASATFTPSVTTTYTVTGTSSGCSAMVSRQVDYHVLPVTQITAAGGITVVCSGDTVSLSASGSGYDYEWKDGSVIVETGSLYKAHATGSYKVVATDQVTGCVDSGATVDVFVNAPPVVSLPHNDTSFCDGGIVTLEVETQDTGLTYVWHRDGVSIPLAEAHFLEIYESGTYKVVVGRLDIASCEDSTNEILITVHDLPVVDITWDGEVLHATPGYASYQWYGGDQGLAGAMDSVHRPAANGSYHVTVVDNNGCTASSAIRNLTNVSVGGEVILEDIRVYPNPSAGMVHIVSPARVDIQLLSVDGRTLGCYENVRSVDLGNYTSGVYLLRILDSNGMPVRHERIIKQ